MFAELHTTPLNPAARHTSQLARRVAADLARHGFRLERVLSDNGSEFRSAEFGDSLRELGAVQTFIRPGRPTTNGAVERVQRTILEECWRPSFARSLVPKIGGLERDLASYLRFYNEERAHTGRYTRGRTPWQTLIGARKMRPRMRHRIHHARLQMDFDERAAGLGPGLGKDFKRFDDRIREQLARGAIDLLLI